MRENFIMSSAVYTAEFTRTQASNPVRCLHLIFLRSSRCPTTWASENTVIVMDIAVRLMVHARIL